MAHEKKAFFRISVLVVLTGYILYAGIGISSGVSYVQEWTIDMGESPPSELVSDPAWIPFIVDNYFGYVSSDGSRLYKSEVQGRVALLPDAFCNYDRLGNNLVIHDPVQNYMYPIDGLGYPFAKNGLFFIISADMTGLSVLTPRGEVLFNIRFISLITSVDCRGGIISVGLLKGVTEIFDTDGNYITGIESRGSRINAVYGTAVAPEGKMIAVCHGIDPQYISLYTRQIDQYILEKRAAVNEQLRSQVIMDFSDDSLQLLVETAEGVRLMGTVDPFNLVDIPLAGDLIDYKLPVLREPLFLLSTDGNRSFLGMYQRDGAMFNREVWEGQATWLYTSRDALYIGFDDSLTRIAMSRGL